MIFMNVLRHSIENFRFYLMSQYEKNCEPCIFCLLDVRTTNLNTIFCLFFLALFSSGKKIWSLAIMMNRIRILHLWHKRNRGIIEAGKSSYVNKCINIDDEISLAFL
ncbi:GfV-C14-ORF1 [Ichnoviriform fumiferanae]|uniref:GfV-C14-ORF1 n=1 Tax=Ichnoviriform fumiferanae TaxID=419435 RepID=A2PZY1_9VIRU|nr:GfV-C14-ORF1 [Ichnoviriform fumiferanae]BAF45553.1 GfV-C14-ORF1 [Ichnoviriform fumiferanae]